MQSGERILFAVFGLFLGFLALTYTSLAGWTSQPTGWERLRDALPTLGLSAVCGVGAVALLSRACNRAARTPLLVLGVVPAGWQAALLLGA